MKPFKVPYRPIPPDHSKLYPAVRTVLSHKDQTTDFCFFSIIDSGSDSCLFPAAYGEWIGLDIEAVKPLKGTGIGGESTIYYHHVDVHFEVESETYHFNCYAGFSRQMSDVGLLGREDFFGLFEKLIFNQKAKLLTLENITKLPDHHTGP